MKQSTGTSGSDTRPSVQGPGSPALAYVNPQPRLPHSEAAPPEQPETFMRRARRVQLGSHRLKLWYLALCTYGRAWTRGEEVLEIGIKQRTLAGELETGINVVSRTLAELRETGLVLVLRKKYHSTIRIFLTPQGQPDTPQIGVSQKGAPGSDTPLLGVSGGVVDGRDTPQVGVTNVFSSCTDVQQQQHPVARRRGATEKQLSGIASMAAELAIPAPEPQNRLEADVVFRELRERVKAQRTARRSDAAAAAKPPRHRIVPALNAGGVCEVCGEPRPDPKGICLGCTAPGFLDTRLRYAAWRSSYCWRASSGVRYASFSRRQHWL